MGVAKLADDAIAVTTKNAFGSIPMLAAMLIPTGARRAAVALLENSNPNDCRCHNWQISKCRKTDNSEYHRNYDGDFSPPTS